MKRSWIPVLAHLFAALLPELRVQAGELRFGTPAVEAYVPATQSWTATLHSPDDRLSLILLAEGYSSSQKDQSRWMEETSVMAGLFLSKQPYKDCAADVVVYRVNCISNGSGIAVIVKTVDSWTYRTKSDTPFDICRLETGRETTSWSTVLLKDPTAMNSGFRDLNGADRFDQALRKIPGLTRAHLALPVFLLHDPTPGQIFDRTIFFRVDGYWPAFSTCGDGAGATLMHETAHQMDLGEEYDSPALLNYYVGFRETGSLPPEDTLRPNNSFRRDIDEPDHRWHDYHRVWWIEPRLIWPPRTMPMPFLFAPSVQCYMNAHDIPGRTDFCPICQKAIRKAIDARLNRINSPPSFTEIKFMAYENGRAGTPVDILAEGEGTSIRLKVRQSFRFTLRARDLDPGRDEQPHSIRFFFLLSDEQKPGYDPTDPQQSTGVAGPWLTRSTGGEFVYDESTWGGFLTYATPGSFEFKLWVLDSGGLISKPKTFTVTVTE